MNPNTEIIAVELEEKQRRHEQLRGAVMDAEALLVEVQQNFVSGQATADDVTQAQARVLGLRGVLPTLAADIERLGAELAQARAHDQREADMQKAVELAAQGTLVLNSLLNTLNEFDSMIVQYAEEALGDMALHDQLRQEFRSTMGSYAGTLTTPLDFQTQPLVVERNQALVAELTARGADLRAIRTAPRGVTPTGIDIDPRQTSWPDGKMMELVLSAIGILRREIEKTGRETDPERLQWQAQRRAHFEEQAKTRQNALKTQAAPIRESEEVLTVTRDSRADLVR